MTIALTGRLSNQPLVSDSFRAFSAAIHLTVSHVPCHVTATPDVTANRCHIRNMSRLILF